MELRGQVIRAIISVNDADWFVKKNGVPVNHASTVNILRERLSVRMERMENATGRQADSDRMDWLRKRVAEANEKLDILAGVEYHSHLVIRSGAERPGPLSLQLSPLEFRKWQGAFWSFYTANGMDTARLHDQKIFLHSMLDDAHLGHILDEKLKLDDHSPVFGADSCMEAFEEEFLLRYPLYRRRLEVLRSRPADGQSYLDWAMGLRSNAREAHMDVMDQEDLFVIFMLNAITDNRLAEEVFSKIDDNPTEHQIIAIANRFRSIEVTSRRIDKLHLAEQREAARRRRRDGRKRNQYREV